MLGHICQEVSLIDAEQFRGLAIGHPAVPHLFQQQESLHFRTDFLFAEPCEGQDFLW
jgi:hypothetical protein